MRPVPIPSFQTIMLPMLKFAADGREHDNREALDALAEQFGLTPEERAQPLPSGKQSLFDNRAQWARSYLKHAGLLASTGRAKNPHHTARQCGPCR
jgi:restriction system protein